MPKHGHRIDLEGVTPLTLDGAINFSFSTKNGGYAGKNTASGYIETTGGGQILSLITSLFMFGIELLKYKRGEA